MYTIKHPITGSKLYVAEDDFPTEMNLEEAKKACAALGRGWRRNPPIISTVCKYTKSNLFS